MQIHSTAFRQKNLAMKKRTKHLIYTIPFSSTLADREAIVAKTTFCKLATNHRQVILPSIKEKSLPRMSQSAPSNFALYVKTFNNLMFAFKNMNTPRCL